MVVKDFVMFCSLFLPLLLGASLLCETFHNMAHADVGLQLATCAICQIRAQTHRPRCCYCRLSLTSNGSKEQLGLVPG